MPKYFWFASRTRCCAAAALGSTSSMDMPATGVKATEERPFAMECLCCFSRFSERFFRLHEATTAHYMLDLTQALVHGRGRGSTGRL